MKKHFFIILNILLLTTFIFGSDPQSPKWSGVCREFLQTHSVCAVCSTQKDLQFHHIIPFHLYPDLKLNPDNLITLCTSKYWGFNCHLIAGHGWNFRYENPWILEDIEKLKVIADPKYIEEHGSGEFDDYLSLMRKRVKAFNLKPQE